MYMYRTAILFSLAALALACGDDPGGTAGAGGKAGGATTGGGNVGGDAGGQGGQGVGGQGGTPAACAAPSDEFDDPATLSCWTELDVLQGDPSQYTLLDIGATAPGYLSVEPTHTLGWYMGQDAVFLFKELSGNFVVETHVTTSDRAAPAQPPSQPFNSAGLLVRDPASGPGAENWLMYNVGFQQQFVGTEGKTTVNSQSVLTLNPGANAGRLRICRVGSDVHMLKWLDDENDWTLEHSFVRDDLPATLQVGMMADGYTNPPDLHARFDWVRFGTVPGGFADCTIALD
jgi:hypothetical protein